MRKSEPLNLLMDGADLDYLAQWTGEEPNPFGFNNNELSLNISN